jgi:hypothetical protein
MRRESEADRARAIERHISERTWGRVHRLTVEVADGCVRVRGRTRSYYVKQLAIQACLEALHALRPARLEVDIEVGGTAPALAH